MAHTFDRWQTEAIELAGGHHLVLAPPGCGKTDILAERIVAAHERGVEYDDMLCLTFTNRAAKGMAQRIAERTGNPVPDKLFVGNIHRYCSQMLFAAGIMNGGSAIVDESDVENIIQEELSGRYGVRCRTSEVIRYQHALLQLTLGQRGEVVLHGDMLRTGAMAKLCDMLRVPFDDEHLAEVYMNIEELCARSAVLATTPAAVVMRMARAYQRYKEEGDLLDYDDLLVRAYQHVGTNSDTHRYGWIEIDEVQDLNALQLALIDKVASEDATVVYLGDEQQAIFSFIGAKLEILQSLKERCSGHIHYLRNNYRSPSFMLALQNDYAVRNLKLSGTALPMANEVTERRDEDLCMMDVGDAGVEAYYAAKLAERYGATNDGGRVAILVSTNKEADEVSETMTAQRIAHFKISGTDIFSSSTMRMLFAHLTVLTDESVFIAWARLLWGMGAVASYSMGRAVMRRMRSVGMLPTDFMQDGEPTYLQRFVAAYDNDELVIFDTETTGLDTKNDDIIQIAAITVRQGRVCGKPFNIILETERELPATVGGAENPMIEVYRNSKRYGRGEGLRKFMHYCQGKVLVGHNATFDYDILDNNLRRECPEVVLREACPVCLDTLKYIRLVRPRMRSYKLVHLIEDLHLEGQNSHKADDDIMATLSLLRFCHNCAVGMTVEQQLFLQENKAMVERFRTQYAPCYYGAAQSGGIVSEMQRVYAMMCERKPAAAVEKWQHVIHYLEADLIRCDTYPDLKSQLSRYLIDLCTLKEADLCGGSLEERYIISTVHKAKGLEFDSVVVYRAIDGNYPGQYSWTEKQIDEDARRLFVAISRARKHLCILYDSHRGNTPHSLSPFLEKVKSHFVCYHRTASGKFVRE